MPYIKSHDGRREALQKADVARNAGELNYQIFYFWKHSGALGILNREYVIRKFVEQFLGKRPNYQKYNDMTGCLYRCRKEIKRRLNEDAKLLKEILDSYNVEIDNYEDLKIQENGDVL